MISRRIGFVFLGVAVVLALALGLWFGAFQRQARQAAPPLEDLSVVVASVPASGTVMAAGSVVSYTVAVAADGLAPPDDCAAGHKRVGGDAVIASVSPLRASPAFHGGGHAHRLQHVPLRIGRQPHVTSRQRQAAGGPAQVGAVLDPPIERHQ